MRKLKKEVKSFLVKSTLFVGVALGGAFLITSSMISEDDIEMKEVVVYEGDTIWNIVQEENKHYNGDIRNLTDWVDANPNIKPGQVIQIPVYKK